MDRFTVVIALSLSIQSMAQSDKGRTATEGIDFNTSLNFEQIKQKAKQENKFIFVDCYASWCGPCKVMDEHIYSLKEVGKFMNTNFVSYKIQMDSVQGKVFKRDEVELFKNYHVKAFPTYLYFSSSGKAVHKFSGALRDTDFIKLSRSAMDPKVQYFTLLEQFQCNKIDSAGLRRLAFRTREFREDSLSKIVARKYLLKYLDNISLHQLQAKKNVDFITTFSDVIKSSDKLFKLIYKNSKEVNLIFDRPRFSESVVDAIINKEDIEQELIKDEREPNWKRILQMIASKYNLDYAERNVINAKVSYYQLHNETSKYIKYYFERADKYGVDSSEVGLLYLNNFLFDVVLKKESDPEILAKAIKWSEFILRREPENFESMDTHANLLYKAGKITEAIKFEERATILEKQNAEEGKKASDPVYKQTLDKMKKGQPTWL